MCIRDRNNTIDEQIDLEAIAQEDAAMEELMDLVSEQVDELTSTDAEATFADAATLKAGTTDVEYPMITKEHLVEGEFFPIRITIDYGPENHKILLRNKLETAYVRGKIVIEKTGRHWQEGTMRTVTFENYFFNDNGFEGQKIYKNEGMNDAGNYVFEWLVEVKVTTPEGEWVKREVNKQREIVRGELFTRWDDEIFVTGFVKGENSAGYSYSRMISEDNPIHRKRVCRFPVAGTVTLTRGDSSFTLDYGNGECDALATITDSEGVVKEITLGKKWKKQ
jgi:hypothetical protein